jgi:hypothetical protein
MEEKKGEEFTVRDRRVSSSDAAPGPAEQQQRQTAGKAEAAGPEQRRQPETRPLPEMDFASFILSLAATAQVHLGLLPDPHTNLTAQDLPAAKQMIDIVGMLKDKTKGNLGQEEQDLIDTVLTNLRMVYVRAAEGKR